MKVLLANLPWIDTEEFYGVRAGSRWPHLRMKKEQLEYYPFPFSLSYAAALLKKEGHEVFLKDCIAGGMKANEFMKYLKHLNPDAVVLETSTPSIYNDLKFTKKIKKEINSTMILCGPHVTALPKQSMLKCKEIDFIMVGEYEYVLRDLISLLQEKKNFYALKGICFRKGRKIILNERYPLIQNLDKLPLPLREQLPMKKYIDPFCKHSPNAQMISSRGCPNQCIYCLEPWVFYGRPNYRMRSPKKIVEEMILLQKEYGAKEIYFDDSSFSVSQIQVKNICKEIKRRKLKIFWSCMADSKMERKTLKAMKDAGCVAVKFGVESANPQILKNINKRFSNDDARHVVKLCRELGIETHATYMFGLPGETLETIKETMNFAFSLGTDTAQFSVATPYPGTKFYEMAKKNKWLKTNDWTKFQGGAEVVIEYPELSRKEILEAVHKARKKIMLKIAFNPRQFAQYVASIYHYAGFTGVTKELFSKLSYVMGRKK